MTTGPKKKSKGERYIMLDVLRGFAVLLMIIFHLAFDLNSFRLIQIEIIENPFWYYLPRFIVSLFLVSVGMGLALVHKKGIKWPNLRRRFYKIGGWALVISLITYLLFPESYIYFGILHCIAVSSLIGVFFVNRPKLSLWLCLAFLISNLAFRETLIPISKWLGISPFDYIPFYPWFGLVLLGIYLESMNFHKFHIKRNRWVRVLETMGRHSLKIYLIHRPILMGLVFLAYQFKA